MSSPAQDARRFVIACLLGMGLGLYYGFLRPLRPKWTTLSDGLFLLGAGWVGLYLGFAVCQGDLRFGYTMGLFAGGFAWELTAGKLLRPVFAGFWRVIRQIMGIFAIPIKKFLEICAKIAKFLLATGRKGSTIKWNKSHHFRQKSGGEKHGSQTQSPRSDPTGIQT